MVRVNNDVLSFLCRKVEVHAVCSCMLSGNSGAMSVSMSASVLLCAQKAVCFSASCSVHAVPPRAAFCCRRYMYACMYVCVSPQDVAASLRSHLDLVAFTEDVPRVRKYLTKRFVAPNGKLSPQVEAALDQGSVSLAAGCRSLWGVPVVGFRSVVVTCTCFVLA